MRTCKVCHESIEHRHESALTCSAYCRHKAKGDKIKIWNRERYERLKDDLEYRTERHKMGRAELERVRAWVSNVKLEAGCCDCGYKKNAAALHFDHIQSNKAINVSRARTMFQARMEIRKCVVRCANCHAEKTWPQKTVYGL